MNKREQRKIDLERHYLLCHDLVYKLTGEHKSGKKISVALFKLEQQAHKAAEQWCSGDINEEQYDNITAAIQSELETVLGKIPEGFFFNSDPRGYTLKLKENSIDLPMHRDWGGYQILSPEI